MSTAKGYSHEVVVANKWANFRFEVTCDYKESSSALDTMSIYMSFNRNKIDVAPFDFDFAHQDPILCVPASAMKFSGVSTTRPRHCPPSQIELLRQVAGLSSTSFIGSQEEASCRWWSLRSETHQLLYDWRGLQIYQAKTVPFKRKTCLSSLFRRSNKPTWQTLHPPHWDFRMEVKDALGIIVLSFQCNRFWFGTDRLPMAEVDEMEVFLGKYKLPIGKLLKRPALPGTRRFSGMGTDYYTVYDEKGALVYYVYLSASVIDHSYHVHTFTIKGYEKRNEVGVIKCSRRMWARWIPKYFFAYGPATISFKEKVGKLPITHKCLLIGALFFIVERTPLMKKEEEVPSAVSLYKPQH